MLSCLAGFGLFLGVVVALVVLAALGFIAFVWRELWRSRDR